MGTKLRNRSTCFKNKLVKDFHEYTNIKFENKTFVPVIDKIFNWKDVENAHGYMKENKNIGKIIMTID
ncbi:zinc-binding dehydrogenase [Salibacterium aidingense]|uniref:zinc-binding dehydrogenase n=1 Tax=Salibacterium aidingense TaxID=384933 RepID=UPI0012EC9A94|nr:zinc-binding dehydrogenase [Salibacterium aidingense]